MSHGIRAIAFDVGNTLMGWNAAVVVERLGAQGIAVSSGELARGEASVRPALSKRLAAGPSTESATIRRYYLEAIWRATPALAEVATPDATRALDDLQAWLASVEGADRVWSQVAADARPTLARLHERGYRLLVISNSDGEVARRLREADLDRHLAAIIDSGALGVEKPAPAIFEHAAARVGVEPAELAHVGDLFHVDIIGVRAVGGRAILIDPHGDWPDRYDVERIATLAELLDRFPGPVENSQAEGRQ